MKFSTLAFSFLATGLSFHGVSHAESTAQNTFELPWTMNALSTQAYLKKILYEAMIQYGTYENPITGDYKQVILEDLKFKLVCEEKRIGILAVQQYRCYLQEKSEIIK